MFTIDDVATHAAVNGDLVALTEAQRQAIADEWNAAMPTLADLAGATLAKARAQRLPIMQVLDGLQASAIVNATTVLVGAVPTPLAQVIEELKQGLRDITAIDLSACATKAEMEQAVYSAYVALAASAPAQVQSAFQSLVP